MSTDHFNPEPAMLERIRTRIARALMDYAAYHCCHWTGKLAPKLARALSGDR